MPDLFQGFVGSIFIVEHDHHKKGVHDAQLRQAAGQRFRAPGNLLRCGYQHDICHFGQRGKRVTGQDDKFRPVFLRKPCDSQRILVEAGMGNEKRAVLFREQARVHQLQMII